MNVQDWDFSTVGLTLEQRRALVTLPGPMKGDWARLCQRYAVERVEADATGPSGWAITSGPFQGTFATSPLILLEVTPV